MSADTLVELIRQAISEEVTKQVAEQADAIRQQAMLLVSSAVASATDTDMVRSASTTLSASLLQPAPIRRTRTKKNPNMSEDEKRAMNAKYQREYRARKAAEKSGQPWPPIEVAVSRSVPAKSPVAKNGATIAYVNEVSLDV